MEAPLLVELLTEELPPKALRRLSEAFGEAIAGEIVKHRLKDRDAQRRVFATPRRLAVLVQGVRAQGFESQHEAEGPLASNAKAVEGFARKHRVGADSLQRRRTDKGEIVVARYSVPGVMLDAVLADIVHRAIRKLPAPKLMRWGEGQAEFVRPVHGLVMMHGERIVPGKVLGLDSSNRTRGHRFLGAAEIVLRNAVEYERRLLEEGRVIASFAERKREIEAQLRSEAGRLGAGLGDCEALLEEVTALVEYPTVYAGAFDARYLEVPPECLVLTMRQNQKYFPLFDADGRLLPRFLIVSNMRVADPRHIVAGNERVVRPRLEDARFFWEQDRRTRLEARVPKLARVVYHRRLGTQLERVGRLKLLAGRIARALGADALLAERAAELAKADLLTAMVGEFPELQGVMGRYYALGDGEPPAVADAIEQHYRPRYAGDRLPETPLACAVALADRLDAIAGLFSAGEMPTGDKDPFGLRRAALGIVRILVERDLPLALDELARAACEPFEARPEALVEFVSERFAGYLRDLGFTTLQVEAVLAKNRLRPNLVPRQLEAVRAFQALPEAESLVAANKRIANILRQAEAKGEPLAGAAPAGLREPAERALEESLKATAAQAEALFERGDYAGCLAAWAALRAPVDAFFDSVRVMAEDPVLRRGRLALLRDLREAMNRVADLSRLAA